VRVLVSCEFSGIVREAFRAIGADAWSCDLLPTEQPGQHIQGDVLDILEDGWDLLIAHPPCTYLTNTGSRWLYEPPKKPGKDRVYGDERWEQVRLAAEFFNQLKNAPIPRIAIENPIPHCHARRLIGRYTQVIQPWMFGHGETKATCLWLKNLPPLVATCTVSGRVQRVYMMYPGVDRWKMRSKTYTGIAAAMAEQWSSPTGERVQRRLL
jgi:hypothetical protein